MRDEVLGNGHGSKLGGARALSGVGGEPLAMFLCGARGWPQRLRSRRVRSLVRGCGDEGIVGDALVPFFVDVGNDEDDALCGR